MVNKCKETIIRYVLDSSNEENECLAVFIARMRDKGGSLQVAREKGAPVSGDGLRKEARGRAALGRGSGAGSRERS